jgi:MFS family permease
MPIALGYSAITLRQAGMANPFIGILAIALVSIVMLFFAGYFVERFGRRHLLNYGGVAMVLCLFVIGGVGFLPATVGGGAGAGATIALLCLWNIAYKLTAGPLGYILLAESSTSRLRAKSVGFAAAISQCFGLVFQYATPLMILPTGGGAGWGLKTAFFYAGVGSTGLALVYFFVPEHSGRSFAELDELYGKGIPARKFSSTVTEAQLARQALRAEA